MEEEEREEKNRWKAEEGLREGWCRGKSKRSRYNGRKSSYS